MGRLSREYLEGSRLELEDCLVPPYAFTDMVKGWLAI